MESLWFKDAQAACRCNSLASNSTPFFQMVKVIAAIFRAKVRRAIVGRGGWVSWIRTPVLYRAGCPRAVS